MNPYAPVLPPLILQGLWQQKRMKQIREIQEVQEKAYIAKMQSQ